MGDEWQGNWYTGIPLDLSRLLTLSQGDQGHYVYQATFKTLATMKGIPEGNGFDAMETARYLPPEFRTVKELAAYLEPIRTSAFVKKHWPKAGNAKAPRYELKPVGVPMTDGYELGNGAATNIYDRIMGFAKTGFASTKFVAIHELSHLIQADEFGYTQANYEDYTGHGPVFARINLMLVEEFLGKDVAKKLENEMFLATVHVAPRSLASRA